MNAMNCIVIACFLALTSADDVDDLMQQSGLSINMMSDLSLIQKSARRIASGEDDTDNDENDGSPPSCRSSCRRETNTKPWKKKCKQAKCQSCEECQDVSANPNHGSHAGCRHSCNRDSNTKPWSEKCKESKCQECPQCSGSAESSTASATPAPTPPVLQSGDVVSVKNLYNDGGFTYLDSCGGSTSCASTGLWRVSTSTESNRDAGTGLWKIVKTNGNGALNSGDTVHMINQYAAGSYLDSCGAAACTEGTQWGVYTNQGSRGSTSEWQVSKVSGSGAIGFDDVVTIKNMYTGGESYLDSCGGAPACAASTKWNVHTNAHIRGPTAKWQFVEGR